MCNSSFFPLAGSYFAGPDDAKPKGTIDMTGVLRIEGEQTWPGKGKGDHNYVFIIEMVGGRVFYLSAPSDSAMRHWVDTLTSHFKRYLLINAASGG